MKTFSTKKMEKSDVEYTQNRIGYDFPKDYIHDILIYGAAQLEPNTVECAEDFDGELCVKSYMSLREGDRESLHTALCATYSINLVPFAYEVIGRFFCFDRATDAVVVYNRITKTAIKIASTYKEFKKMIKFQ